MNEEEKFLKDRCLTIDDYYTMNDDRQDATEETKMIKKGDKCE